MIWFSTAEFFYQWKDKGYPTVKIQKDQRKPMTYQKHCDFTFQLMKCIIGVQNYVQSARNLSEV